MRSSKLFNLREKLLLVLFVSLFTLSVIAFPKPVGKVYSNTLIGVMESGSPQIKKIVHDILRMKDNDVMYLYIDSPGGEVAAYLDIKTALDMHHGKVIAVLTLGHMAASAAAMTFIAADGFIIKPGSMFMLHRASQFVNCKNPATPTIETCEMKKMDDNDGIFAKWANEMVMSVVQQAINRCLIPQSDYARVLKGEDVYHTGNEIIQELKKCNK